jgi:hypothetical protein
MDRIYVFLIRNDIWIYFLSAIGLVWYLTEYWRSRRILRSAIFGLEKEKGGRIRQRAITLVILFLGIIALVTYVNLSIAPTLPIELLKPPTPTPNIFSTPLSVPPSAATQGTVTLEVAPTVTLAGSGILETASSDSASIIEGPTETPDPEILTGDCSPEINISSPPDGTAVGNSLTLFGTATGEQLASYNLETLGPDSDGNWNLRSDANSPAVQDGILGTLSFDGLPTGIYYVRLRAFSGDGVEIGHCTIELLVGLEPS